MLCGVIVHPAVAEVLNFNEFQNIALNNAYEIVLAKLNKQITEKGIKEARAGYFPTLGAYATAERYNDLSNGNSQISTVGNEILLNRDYYQEAASAYLAYNIFDFGERRKTLDIAKQDDKQKEILILKNTRDLKLDTVDIYAEALNSYKQKLIIEKIVTLKEELLTINKRLKDSGELSDIDLTDAEIELSECKTELETINNSLAKTLTKISYYTGKNYILEETALNDFPEDDTLKKTENGAIKLSAEIIKLVPQNTPEAKIYDLEIKKKEKEYLIQKKANFPKLRFDTRYSLYGQDPNDFIDSANDISKRSFSLRLSTSFTLFDGLKNINTAHKKKLEIEKTKIEKEKELADLKTKYEQIQLDYINAVAQEENNKRTLSLVNKNLENLERLNTNGIIAKAECVKKQVELLRKKQNLEENKIKNFVAQFKIKVLTEEMIRESNDI